MYEFTMNYGEHHFSYTTAKSKLDNLPKMKKYNNQNMDNINDIA